jgi:hypothetical protein
VRKNLHSMLFILWTPFVSVASLSLNWFYRLYVHLFKVNSLLLL